MSVDAHEPHDPDRYAMFVQDGIHIYYSPKLARKADLLELDYVRVLFRHKLAVVGPDELMASIIMGRM